MNKLVLAAAAGVAAVGLAAPASADIYGGAGYTVFSGDGDDSSAVSGRVGMTFNPFMAVEGEASFGLDDDGFENQYGAFAVGRLPIPLVADLFARVGYSEFNFDGGDGGGGMAYGAGAEFRVLILRVRAEYTRYEIEDEEVDSFGASAILKF